MAVGVGPSLILEGVQPGDELLAEVSCREQFVDLHVNDDIHELLPAT